MADLVVRNEVGYKRRNPWGVFGLSIVTLGVYWVVWHYKTNNHLQNYGIENNPALATLAIIPGSLVVVPALVSWYRTGDRIRQAQDKSGASERISPWLALILFAIFEPLGALYCQKQLNRAWDAEAERGAEVQPV